MAPISSSYQNINSLVTSSYLNCRYNHLFRYCLKGRNSVVNLPFPVDRYPYNSTLYYLRLRVHLRTFRHIFYTLRFRLSTWNDLVQKFLTKFFPPSKIAQLVQEINTFGQLEGENLAEAWDRFHELLRKCPHHRLTRWMQVHTFYNGLRNATRTMIDASAGGALMKKTTDQAYEILEDAATNTNQWPRERATLVNTVGCTDNAVLNNLVNHVAQLTK